MIRKILRKNPESLFPHPVAEVARGEGRPTRQLFSKLGIARLEHLKTMRPSPDHDRILGMRVDCTSYIAATKRITQWAREGRSAMVCLGNVHMVMTTYDDPEFAKVIEDADLVTNDGVPLVWAMRLLGHTGLERVYGPHLMNFLCHAAAKRGIPIGLYGGSPEVLEDLCNAFESRYPGIKIPFRVSPPYRPTTKEEEDRDLKALRESGARILFVGIGCPKQEFWMYRNRRRFAGPMLGVGQAFDIHSGHSRMAPRWMQNVGMEWFYRLCTEPRRLWKRYLKNNPRYLALFAMQLFTIKVLSRSEAKRNPLYTYIRSIIDPHLRPKRGGSAHRRK